MKILVVSPYLPSPPRFGGQRRIDGLVRQLAERHDVSVLAFNASDEWAESSLEATRSYCRDVRTLADLEPRAPGAKRTGQLRSLLSWHSYEHALTRRADFQREFDAMLSTGAFDVVQVEFTQLATLRIDGRIDGRIDRRSPAPVFVLDEHNIEYDILRRTATAGSGVARSVYNSLNWRKLAREERSAWRRFDGVAVTSARDEAVLRSDLPGCRTAIVPNGVDVTSFAPSAAAVDPDTLLFFGAVNYFPNHDGVTYFVQEVLPLVKRRRPSVTFRVLGHGATPDVLGFEEDGVELLGMVDDVNPHIDRAAVVVVPLRLGGGTRLKIVEALAKGKAVVSTHLGAEGLDVVDDVHLLLADEPEEIAAAIERILGDPGLATRLGIAGRALMEERYSWTGITARLEQFYDELLHERLTDRKRNP